MLIKAYCDGCGDSLVREPNGWEMISTDTRFDGVGEVTIFVADTELCCQNCGKPAHASESWKPTPTTTNS